MQVHNLSSKTVQELSKSKNVQENIGCHTCCHKYQTLELKHRFCLHEAGLNSGWILQKAKSNLTFTYNQLPIQLFPCSTISPITDANIIFSNTVEVLLTYLTNLSWPQAYNYKDNWHKAHYWAMISS